MNSIFLVTGRLWVAGSKDVKQRFGVNGKCISRPLDTKPKS
jgi:hypothetical protein